MNTNYYLLSLVITGIMYSMEPSVKYNNCHSVSEKTLERINAIYSAYSLKQEISSISFLVSYDPIMWPKKFKMSNGFFKDAKGYIFILEGKNEQNENCIIISPYFKALLKETNSKRTESNLCLRTLLNFSLLRILSFKMFKNLFTLPQDNYLLHNQANIYALSCMSTPELKLLMLNFTTYSYTVSKLYHHLIGNIKAQINMRHLLEI